MRLFISYSTGDLEIVKQIADALRPHAEVYYWARDQVPGNDAWQTIFNWIILSDLVVAVITDKTVSRAMSVGQEIGHAKARGKTIIPLVGKDVPVTELGCLCGITHIQVSSDNLSDVVDKVKSRIASMKQAKEREKQILYAILAVIGLAWLFGGSDDDKEYWR